MAIDSYHHVARPPAPGAPLVFAFHGTGGNEQQFAGMADRLVPGAGLVAPRGDVFESGAARFFRRTAEGVYDMADLAGRTERMARFVRAHASAHPDAPVYGLGYSNGANILASVMFHAPDLFDRAALLHPLIPWTPTPVSGLEGRRVVITAGRADPICPWPSTEALIAWFRDAGALVTPSIHAGGHEIRDSEIAAMAETFAYDRVAS